MNEGDLDFFRSVIRQYENGELARCTAETKIFERCVKYIVDNASRGEGIFTITGGTGRRHRIAGQPEPEAEPVKTVDVRIEFRESDGHLVISPPGKIYSVMNG